MKSVSAALKAHLAQETTTLATLWLITRSDGIVFGFTDAASDIPFGGVTYLAATGYSPTNIQTTAALNVDNLEVVSVLDSSTITEADMMAGLWDYAAVQIMLVNYADLSMGSMALRRGWLGQIKTGRSQFTAELRGIAQPLQQSIGRVCLPACDADLGDVRCGVNLAALAVSGSVTGLISQSAFLDTARTETNSTTAKAITGITQANPAVVTCPAHGFAAGTPVTLTGIVGMAQLNGYTGAITYLDANRFSVAVNASAFTAYSSGGTATLAVASEFFQGGLLTWTGGGNAGRKMEVASYHPNFIGLFLPMGTPIQIGDAYTLTPACDKLLTTCRSRYNNVINFRGFPYVPGDTALLGGT